MLWLLHTLLLRPRSSVRLSLQLHFLFHVLRFLSIFALTVLSFVAGYLSDHPNSLHLSNLCLKHTSSPSTLPPTVPLSYTPQTFNGSLLQETAHHLRGSPEVDALWSALGVEYRPFVVPEEEDERVGLKIGKNVKVNEKYGGAWLGNLEGLHQLHCLVSNREEAAKWMHGADEGVL